MAKWQPIQTAPENEQVLLAQCVPWHGWYYEVGMANKQDSFFKPTHWKPIKPPKE